MPSTSIKILGAAAVALLAISALLGSSGKTDGDTSVGQDIANVTMPLAILLILLAIVLAAVAAVRSRR